jgi:GT2 family glycosyltransferase
MPPATYRIAVILSCFNRKQKTLDAIECVQAQSALDHAEVDFFVTDDGSKDGTGDAVRARYTRVRVLNGDGRLYWNGGMRLAWDEAFRGSYDFFLWLNDDTFLFPDTLQRMLDTHRVGMSHGGKPGIVVGSTQDQHGRTSYGGELRKSRLRPLTLTTIAAADHIQSCDTFNGNCVLISNDAAAVLGNLDARFIHAIGDTDYGLRARRAGIPMWVMPGHAGRCVNDHAAAGSFTDRTLPLRVRLRKVMEPKGLPWKAWLVLCRRHAGPLWPIYWLWPYLKIVSTSLVRKAPKGQR